MRIRALMICGSLRKGSSNGELLEAYVKAGPASIHFSRLETLGALPLYNPDLDDGGGDEVVRETRRAVSAADVLIISTPEYIHALPAVMKNLLEWLVSDPAFYGKRVVILDGKGSPGFAVESLKEVLRTMSARIMTEACIAVKLGSNRVRAAEILEKEEWKGLLAGSSRMLVKGIEGQAE